MKHMNNKLMKGYKFNSFFTETKNNKKLKIGLISIEPYGECVSAFTKNLLKSNSIIVSQEHLKKTNKIKYILTNSGCANTACGKDGLKITEEICGYLAKQLGIKKEEVLIASTGVIGEPLPKEVFINSIPKLISSLSDNKSSVVEFAKSILTTDTKPKVVYKHFKNNNVLCIAKGAGMIAPQLKLYKPHATMLVFLLTDLWIEKKLMEKLMKETVVPLFNSFSIDGDTSPNDTIFFVSLRDRNSYKLSNNELKKFSEVLKFVCEETIKQLLFDGEGVTKVVKIIIENCSKEKSEVLARTISNSLLVKTAINGADPNWGRILAAIGRSGVKLDIDKVDIYIGKHCVVKNGTSNFVNDKVVRETMLNNFFEIKIDIKSRKKESFVFYTTDLSKKYVDINSKYKT
jgi:glutamate N-acetyltransferase/amino-acid N-acetyltransferase